MRVQQHINLSADTVAVLNDLQQSLNIKTRSALIDHIVKEYVSNTDHLEQTKQQQKAVDKKLDLVKKYLNECRRNDFLILSMLNALAIEGNVTYAPDHTNERMQSGAFKSARENLREYMQAIQIRLKGKDPYTSEFDDLEKALEDVIAYE